MAAPKKKAESGVRRLGNRRDGLMRREPRSDDFVLDLNSIEKERVAGTFSLVIEGRTIDFLDASDVDWQDLLNLGRVGDPYTWLQSITTDDDFQFLISQSFEGWKFERILREYQDHYGVDNSGNVAGSRGA